MILHSPFDAYPYYVKVFDVSGKRKPDIDEYIDQYLCDERLSEINAHKRAINNWNKNAQQIVQNSKFKNLRQKQYDKLKDDAHAYKFYFSRQQTRYKQTNYQKQSYIVNNITDLKTCDYFWLLDRYKELESINFETTLKKYKSKSQRKLMTRELRESIMQRDNYTCQLCGKYMPDEIGLQVDHIIPVAKGGKSIPSNLQVLCSKCNGHKSDKL